MTRTPWMWLGGGLLLVGLWTGHAVFGALPQAVNTNSPANTDPISQGAQQIRDFKLFTTDVFGIPATPSQVNAAAMAIATSGIVNFPSGVGSMTTMVGITGYLRGNGSGTVTGVALPVFGRVVRTAGNITTTSTSLVDLTGASITLTTEAFPVQVSFAGTVSIDSTGQILYLNIDVDGANELGTGGLRTTAPVLNYELAMTVAHQTAALTAAPHTIKLRWSVGGNTGTMLGNTTNPYSFSVAEIK